MIKTLLRPAVFLGLGTLAATSGAAFALEAARLGGEYTSKDCENIYVSTPTSNPYGGAGFLAFYEGEEFVTSIPYWDVKQEMERLSFFSRHSFTVDGVTLTIRLGSLVAVGFDRDDEEFHCSGLSRLRW